MKLSDMYMESIYVERRSFTNGDEYLILHGFPRPGHSEFYMDEVPDVPIDYFIKSWGIKVGDSSMSVEHVNEILANITHDCKETWKTFKELKVEESKADFPCIDCAYRVTFGASPAQYTEWRCSNGGRKRPETYYEAERVCDGKSVGEAISIGHSW